MIFEVGIDDIEIDEADMEMPTKSKRRAIRRKTNAAKARRKRDIANSVTGFHYDSLHQYSKNKIHCSCWMCAFNHKKSGYVTLTHSDMKRIASMNVDVDE